jgi:hypothetical protein
MAGRQVDDDPPLDVNDIYSVTNQSNHNPLYYVLSTSSLASDR